MEVINLLKQFYEEHKTFLGNSYNFNAAICEIKYIENILKMKFFNSETFEIDALFINDIDNYKHLTNDEQLLLDIVLLARNLIIKYDAYFMFRNLRLKFNF
jgi:antirestriction protein